MIPPDDRPWPGRASSRTLTPTHRCQEPFPEDSCTSDSAESTETTGTDTAPLWASTPIEWSSSLMDLCLDDTCDTPLPDDSRWSVHPSEFVPTEEGFALEIRAETIEQLTSRYALRRGDVERMEVGSSDSNTDAVRGRDRVKVNGRLQEHTGGSLMVDASNVEFEVDGNVDIHATRESDSVRILGNMRDQWKGGLTQIGSTVGDLAYGGCIRVCAPLGANVAGLLYRGMMPAMAGADGVLSELGGLLVEREYGATKHRAMVAVFMGSLYIAERPGFLPLMRIVTGVRNLTSAAAGGEEDGSNASSPPPETEGSDSTSTAATSATINSGSTSASTTSLDSAGTSGSTSASTTSLSSAGTSGSTVSGGTP